MDHERFSYTVGDVCDRALVAERVDAADRVFHLAAAVGVRLIIEDPVRTIETNIEGTEVVLQMAAKKRRPVFLASSSEVYGKSNAAPFSEEDDLVLGATSRQRWAYAASKAVDEFLGLAYHRAHGVPVVIGRFFNVVGPRQTGRYGMVLPTFARAALRAEPIRVFGDGSQSRCFLHVEDAASAAWSLLETTDAVGRVFNIGSCEEVTILELAERVRTLAESASPIELVPYDRAYAPGFEDMQRRVPSLDRLRSTIPFDRARRLETVIRDVLAWMRSAEETTD
jgi:UDP-glucose 4-epimerase